VKTGGTTITRVPVGYVGSCSNANVAVSASIDLSGSPYKLGESVPSATQFWCANTAGSGSWSTANNGYQKQWTVQSTSASCIQIAWTGQYTPGLCGTPSLSGLYRIPIERVMNVNPSGINQFELQGSGVGWRATIYSSYTLKQSVLFDTRNKFIGTSFAVSDAPLQR
jgi:hypothetical protein